MRNKLLFILFLTIITFSFPSICFSESNTNVVETDERWIYYGTTEKGNHFYDKSSITKVSSKVIKVWTKLQFSNVENRYTVSLHELDCVNRTEKYLKVILYNNQGEILHDSELSNPEIRQIIPESLNEGLLKNICNSDSRRFKK